RLPAEQAHLTHEAAGTLAHDLVSGRVQDRRLAFEDDDQRIARITDPEQELPLGGRVLLAVGRKGPELPFGEGRAERAGWVSHEARVAGARPRPTTTCRVIAQRRNQGAGVAEGALSSCHELD